MSSSKRQKTSRAADLDYLNEFRRKVPYVSKSALAGILKEGKVNGFPVLDHRNAMTEAAEVQMSATTEYGPLLNTIDMPSAAEGHPIRLNILNPISLLCILLATSIGFSGLVERVYDAKPCSVDNPWRIALYSDEVTPGDAFSVHLSRKVQVVYWSFLEFGHFLSNENSWMLATAKRSSEVAKTAGQMSKVMGTVSKLFVADDSNFHATGILVKLATGRKIRIFADIAMFIQDGGAHKATFHCKGDAGSRFCMLCRNVFSIKSELGIADAAELGDDGYRTTIITTKGLHMATNEEVIESVERVHHFKGIDRPELFEERQIANGFSWSPYNLLLDPDLQGHIKPADQFCHDWMHCLFQSGVWNVTVFLVLSALAKAGFKKAYPQLRDYLYTWQAPQKFGGKYQKLWKLFENSRQSANNDAKKFKCQAGAALSLFAVLHCYFSWHADKIPAEVDVYQSLCDLIELFLAANRSTITAEEIVKGVENFLAKFCRVFGYNKQTPKFHWFLHFGRHYKKFETLLSCFVHERKHKVLKRYCENMRNTIVFEVSVLSEVCNHLMQAMVNDPFDDTIGLISPHQAPKADAAYLIDLLGLTDKAAAFKVSSNARHSTISYISCGDVVLYRVGGLHSACRVCMLVEYAGRCLVVGQHLKLTEANRADGTDIYEIGDDFFLSDS